MHVQVLGSVTDREVGAGKVVQSSLLVKVKVL